jgi:hypothetical protein
MLTAPVGLGVGHDLQRDRGRAAGIDGAPSCFPGWRRRDARDEVVGEVIEKLDEPPRADGLERRPLAD